MLGNMSSAPIMSIENTGGPHNHSQESREMDVDSEKAGHLGGYVCMFHDTKWRSSYQFATNQLRKVGLLPACCAHAFGKEVCSCRDKNNNREVDMTTEDLPALKDWTFEQLKSWTRIRNDFKPFLHLIERVFDKCIIDSTNGSSTKLSPNFLICLKALLQQNYTRFQNNAVAEARVDPQHVNGKFEIENLNGYYYIGLVVGKGGTHIKPLCSKYNTKAKLRFTNRYESPGIEVTTKSTSVNDFLAFKSKLINIANVVYVRRERHNRRQRERASMFRMMDSLRISNQKGKSYVDGKAAATEHYERKHQKDRRNTGERNNKPTPILEYGRCRYCLSTFKKHDDHEGSCRYHEGYIVARKTSLRWSCCRRKALARHPTMDSHLNGCRKGRHTWRISKRNSPKNGKWRAKGSGNRVNRNELMM
ncbi:uncharacterized protein LOC144437809 [Glandiceps talaboti]